MNVNAKFVVRSFTVPELIRDRQKMGQSLAMPTLSIPLQKVLPHRLFIHSMCTRFPTMFDCSFEWGLRIPNL